MLAISINDKQWRQLEKLGSVSEKIVSMTLQRTGQTVMNDAKIKAPYLRGDLRRSITMTPAVVPLGASLVRVWSDKPYARIQDIGGIIRPRRAKRLAFKVNGQYVTASQVKIRGNKYMTNAFEKGKKEFAQVFSEEFNHYMPND